MKRFSFALVFILSVFIVAPTAFAQNGIIRLGMEGPPVTTIQEHLSSLGYEISVDGQFGQETERAVRHFQKEKGLLVDGIAGPETRLLLEEAAATVLHTVKRGDTLQGLASAYGTSIEHIRQANSLRGDMIIIGQELVIPHVSRKTFTYVVEAGDSLSVIAAAHSTTVETIREMNQLRGDFICVGDELILPEGSASGGVDNYVIREITHVVRSGETLSSISQQYDVPVATIKSTNHLSSDLIRAEERLVIPNPSTASQQKLTKGSLLWPVKGMISSPFGWRNHPIYNYRQFHGGIDIVVPTGTPVKAAFSGVVVGSHWEGGFGKTVVIDHGDSLKTFYAHNSEILVSVGDEVLRGDVIAYSGNTGVSTGPHLDFRVFINGEVVNPLEWLP